MSETEKFAAGVLGFLRSAADSASRSEQVEDSMSRLAFAISRPKLISAFLKFSQEDQRRVMVEIDRVLGTILLTCGCGLPRL